VDHEAVLERADGREVEIDLTVVPLRSELEQETGLLLVGRDVTEMNANRRALQRADRLSGLGEIVSGVAHELKNPLSGVLGHAQLLSLREELGPDARRDAQRIVENAKRCRRIVRNLLDFARRRAPEESLVSVGDLLETVLELSSYQLKTQDVRVVHEIDPRLPPTVLDPHRMEQVFLNLIQNAALSLAGEDRQGTITVRAHETRGEILVEIEDDGPGVPADIREKIFEPFYSTRQAEGTGLGLSIAVGIVEEHGGRLELASGEGRGALFRVYLPRRDAAAESLHDPTGAAFLESGGGRRVLVVVREAEQRERLTLALEEAGYTAEVTATGRVAVEILEQESGIRAVVADLEGLAPNGAALAERYGERTPFILLTADRGLARHYGPNGDQDLCPVLRKPVNLDETLSVLAGLLDRVESAGRDVAGAGA
jgi:signal transduction histidine kinase